MATRNSCISFLLLFLSYTCKAQRSDTVFIKDWIAIDTLIVKNDLTKTALHKLDILYAKAKHRQLPDQLIKILIYRYSLEDKITTNNPAHTINSIKTEIGLTSHTTQKALLYSLLAKQYTQYYDSRRWNIYGRHNTAGIKKDDITTWSNEDFTAAITDAYIHSLQEPGVLQKVNIDAYSAIIIKGNSPSLRPTMYDLVAHDALDYFKSGNAYLTKPAFAFTISDARALAPLDIFMQVDFPSRDSMAHQWLALNLFRQLLAFHKADKNKDALIDLDLERIQWVYQQAIFTGKDAIYQVALQDIIDHYPAVPSSSTAWYLLAAKEMASAQNYAPFGDTSGHFGYIKAKQIIEKALPLFKEPNNGAINMRNLLNGIRGKQLNTQTERVNVPGKPFRALVRFRNIDSLFGRIIRIDADEPDLINMWSEDYWKKIRRLSAYRTFVQPLPLTGDFQQHSVEIKIDALPVGEYLLLTSDSPAFNDSLNKMTAQAFYVSGISYIRNGADFFVLDRETGLPMPNVKTAIYEQLNNNRHGKLITEKTSDINGHFIFSENTAVNNFRYVLSKGNDRLMLRQNDYVYYRDNIDGSQHNETELIYEERNKKMFFFTDRAIYRPGQVVFCKGIAVTRDYNTRQSKLSLASRTGWVYLQDVNRKSIDSVQYTLNEYASFSARFQLPQNVLTGQFSLFIRNYEKINAEFRVEEYKRPTFTITLDRPKGAYRLNDSIIVTGAATAFAGNVVDGAKVSYRITRNARYVPWIGRRPVPNLPAREIAQGQTSTLPSGKFIIPFKALADDIADRLGNPLFTFHIQVNITDQAGETHTASTDITAGFSSMLLQLSAKSKNDIDSSLEIGVTTTNLSNEKENALVGVKIYSLKNPSRPVRQRYWERPDQYVMTENVFLDYFPTDEYQQESNYLTWEKGKLLKEDLIDTKSIDHFIIPEGTFEAGYYLVEAVTKDTYGMELKQVIYLEMFSRRKNQLPIPSYNFQYTIADRIEPGQTALFLTGSAANKLFVVSTIEKPQTKTGQYDFEYREKGIHTIMYSATESDRGGVHISEAYVYNNRVYINRYDVTVPWSNKELQVTYASYRDKTEPGSAEKWTVTLQGPKGDMSAAELLTGMYDASLDQFATHKWTEPYLWENFNSTHNFIASVNFGTEQSGENNLPVKYFELSDITYDRLPTDGSDLWYNDLAKWLNDSTIYPAIHFNRSLATLQEAIVVGYPGSRKRDITGGVSQNMAMVTKAGSRQQGADMEMTYNKTFTPPALVKDGESNTESNPGIISPDVPATVIRRNFNETAFFFPQLQADSSGRYSFSFIMPEALTQWKWMSLAHTKDLAFGSHSATIVTQKKLMVQSNAPRFLREGDNMELSTRVVNLSDKEITGQVTLQLVDPSTNTPVDGWFQNVFPSQYFTVSAGQSFAVKFPIQIPFSFNRPLTWRVVARTGEFSDGEENTLPVLTNRTLVTESLPLFLPRDTTLHFRFEKLIQTSSETLTHEGITVEYTSNPVWYAVQALPYLMEFPYECSEQTFNRLYANTLASFILNKDPLIRQVFQKWAADSSALKSSLQKNEELKQLLLQETPWVLNAENEAQQKKNIALLFDMAKAGSQADASLEKLRQAQLPDGSFSWFRGGYADRYMTNYILTGIGKLKRLGALTPDLALRIRIMLVNALKYMDAQIATDYNRLIKSKANMANQHISGTQIDYLYMRSFFGDIAQQSPEAYNYFLNQGKQYWITQNDYYRALLGLISYRAKDENFATGKILPAILENASTDSSQGMYWKSTYTSFWHQSPIEHQSLLIAFMSEIKQDDQNRSLTRDINAMKTWLLLHKQTNNWRTTTATADACYALLLQGSDWPGTTKKINIGLGNLHIDNSTAPTEAGTGYFKKRVDGRSVIPAMGNITVTAVSAAGTNDRSSDQPSWGSVYWQYFEDLDKITPAVSPLSINKKLFIERNTGGGILLEAVKEGDELKTGDKIVIRMELKSDRDMDYLHLKDMRAASMEPVNVLSTYKWQDGLGYYESTRDASTNFFISHMQKGTYVFEYPVFITHTGIFSAGIATIQCMYAPEFSSHSGGLKIRVSK